MKKVGHGIFTWEGSERRSRRYGFFALLGENFNTDAFSRIEFDLTYLQQVQGQRVRLKAVVREARKSGHIGDLILKIEPSQPEPGEEIELGVGTLRLERDPALGWTFGVQPSDGREVFWVHPQKLYRLHDQTVDLYVEPTSDLEHEAPDLPLTGEMAVAVGDGQSLQVVGRLPSRVLPTTVSLGEGLFSLSAPSTKGAVLTVEYPDK